MAKELKSTDTIPRASVAQLFEALRFIRTQQDSKSTYDAVRARLVTKSNRRAPNTSSALWTVARDVLYELEKLGLVEVGALPRKLSDIERLRATPCSLTASGEELADVVSVNAGRAYDTMLALWLAHHPYFVRFNQRLNESPLFIPDVTKLAQLGIGSAKDTKAVNVLAAVRDDCVTRLSSVGWAADKLDQLKQGIERLGAAIQKELEAPDNDAKKIVDMVQDNVVLPAFLNAEGLPFDPVTLQQIVKYSQDFLSAGWTSSHPRFTGRVIFSTCEFVPGLNQESEVELLKVKVLHHGVTFAEEKFLPALLAAYSDIAGPTSGYVNAYSVRAAVSAALHIPLGVFNRCLEGLIAAGTRNGLTIYTELPFNPPPPGEIYIEAAKRRIGQMKLTYNIGERHGA